jgi:membrane protease subunit HflC
VLAIGGGQPRHPARRDHARGRAEGGALLREVRTVTEPGISLAIPFVEEVRSYPSSWLYNGTEALAIQTKDGEQLEIDNYTIWRIANAREFMTRFPEGVATAEQRIDRVVRDSVSEVISRHTPLEV